MIITVRFQIMYYPQQTANSHIQIISEIILKNLTHPGDSSLSIIQRNRIIRVAETLFIFFLLCNSSSDVQHQERYTTDIQQCCSVEISDTFSINKKIQAGNLNPKSG